MTDQFNLLAYCRPHLEPALDYAGNTHTWDDIAQGVLSNRYQLWYSQNSSIITEIIDYPRLRDLHFFLVGGDMEELRAMRGPIEEWGKEQGCSRVSCAGRKGWARSFLKDEGYNVDWVVMTKGFENAETV